MSPQALGPKWGWVWEGMSLTTCASSLHGAAHETPYRATTQGSGYHIFAIFDIFWYVFIYCLFLSFILLLLAFFVCPYWTSFIYTMFIMASIGLLSFSFYLVLDLQLVFLLFNIFCI